MFTYNSGFHCIYFIYSLIGGGSADTPERERDRGMEEGKEVRCAGEVEGKINERGRGSEGRSRNGKVLSESGRNERGRKEGWIGSPEQE